MYEIFGLRSKRARLMKRVQRERRSRVEAEDTAERGMRDLYDVQRALTLIEEISAIANEAPGVDAVMAFAVRQIRKYRGWVAGHVYLQAQGSDGDPVTTEIWQTPSGAGFDALREATESNRFLCGSGMPGQVMATGEPAWFLDLDDRENIPRAVALRRAGVVAGYGFPVLIGSQVAGVLEFFSTRAEEPDDRLLRLMAYIGGQLGLAIERQRSRDRLTYQSLHDPLTSLANRTLFMERLNQAAATTRAARDPNQRFALLFLDLDRFKAINDALGHQAGDELLVLVAERLSAGMRDDHGRRPLIGRLGGDEFTILLENVAEERDVIAVAEQLMRDLQQPYALSDTRHVNTTASIGIATGGGDRSGAEVLRHADIALYHAKKKGRARWELFDEQFEAGTTTRPELERDLHHAIENQELRVYFQPIVRIKDGKAQGFEALVRWQHPDKGWILPGEFIALAEETGQICAIDRWVLREACIRVKRWHDTFPSMGELYVSVNVSAVEFARRDFVENVVETLRKTGLEPRHLKLEITESAALVDPDRAQKQLQQLLRLGVRFSLDDFGTGFSSLSYLLRLSIHALKIDRSFVSDIDADRRKLHVLQTIIALARGLDIEVIAEGTETQSEVSCLSELSCQYAQGFYFAKPMEERAAETLLSKQYGGKVTPLRARKASC